MKIFITILLSFLLLSCYSVPEVKKEIESPFYWDKNSNTQIKIYTDFQCPACIVFEQAIWKTLFEKYALTNKIWLTYKMFPLPKHTNAKDDAISVLCSSKQWKYSEFSTKMYELEKEKDWKTVTFENRLQIARDIKLNEAEFTTCVNEKHYLNKIESDIKDWNEKDNLKWTPSIFMNWVLIDMSSITTIDDFFKLIDNQTWTWKIN
jgi:protein-disulfide isomerase